MSAPRTLHMPDGLSREQITVQRGSMAALRSTPPAGETVRGTAVLVPGFTGSKEDFLPILAALAARGWETIAVDQLGQHESDHLGSEAAYDLDAVAADLVELVAGIPGPVHLLGHSYGGLVGRSAVLAGADVASYVHLCSGAGPIPQAAHVRLSLLRQVLPAMSLRDVHAAAAELDRLDGVDPLPPEVEEFMRSRFVANDPEHLRAAASTLMTVADTTPVLARRVAEGLRVAIVYGEADDAWPIPEQVDMAARLGVPAVGIPGTAHSPAVEDPDATVDVLDGFWSHS